MKHIAPDVNPAFSSCYLPPQAKFSEIQLHGMQNVPSSIPASVHAVLEAVVSGVEQIFSSQTIGIYLFGSLTYGDFMLESSDIDVEVVLTDPASDKQLQELAELHSFIAEKFPIWQKRLEVSYTPLAMLHSTQPPENPRPYFGEGTFYTAAPYGNEWIINNYLLQEHGIALIGPDFSHLLSPVTIEQVQLACIRDLFTEWEPKLRNPQWLDNSHYQAYLVLNLCRILHTVLNAKASSKKVSAEWVKAAFPQWRELVDAALSWKFGDILNTKEKALSFTTFVVQSVKETELYRSNFAK